MDKKVLHRYFSLADYIEEQDFLQDQHKQGWKFKELRGFTKYIFEKAEPEETIYQLDNIQPSADEENYLQMFADYGWEYITKYNTWYYFRKPMTAAANDDLTIFSDPQSKLEIINRSCRTQIASLCCLSLALITYIFLIPVDIKNNIFSIIFVLFCLFFISFGLRNYFKFMKLEAGILKAPNDKT